MRVGLNLIFLVPGETGGMEVYARELIEALVSAEPSARFTAFINREAAGAPGGPWEKADEVVTVPVNARNRVEWVFGEQTLLPPLARRAGVQVMHSLASTSPAWGRFRRVVTVHDLIYARFPEAHAGMRSRGMRLLVPLAVRRSDRVIAISASTRDDLIQLLGTPAGKIDVVPQGLGTLRRAVPLREALIRERLGLGGRPVALSLSAKRPHKNLVRLIEALVRIPAERRPVLVLPGYPTWHEAELRERIAALDLDSDVRLVTWLSEEELEGLWDLAELFVYPSLYEGFGLPVLEAMARGVPVACSHASSLPEVAGEAALLFDPLDEAAIASAIETLLERPDARARLQAAGRLRAQRFTWERTARDTLVSYERALGSRAAGEAPAPAPAPASPPRAPSE